MAGYYSFTCWEIFSKIRKMVEYWWERKINECLSLSECCVLFSSITVCVYVCFWLFLQNAQHREFYHVLNILFFCFFSFSPKLLYAPIIKGDNLWEWVNLRVHFQVFGSGMQLIVRGFFQVLALKFTSGSEV